MTSISPINPHVCTPDCCCKANSTNNTYNGAFVEINNPVVNVPCQHSIYDIPTKSIYEPNQEVAQEVK